MKPSDGANATTVDEATVTKQTATVSENLIAQLTGAVLQVLQYFCVSFTNM